MASSKEVGGESVTGYDDEDIRGDSKKKKFKPLSAMKKFFTKKRGEKKETVVAIKAKSTTALHSGYRTDDDEDDDDGGFKSHTKPISLAAVNRSLSEDSVFSPEPRGPSIPTFPKSAVSEESLPKSAFQSELLSKLNQRRHQGSDDYHDDGLPRSPVPPLVTTADVLLGEPLKKQPGQSGKTSNRDSDQSLISVGSSENEEEDLFQGKWKSSAVSKKLGHTESSTASGPMDSFDLNSIQKTELLVSRAAKDRILVKPKRKGAARQSHMKKDNSAPTPSLPSLNEESPFGSKAEDGHGDLMSVSPTAKSPNRDSFFDETSPPSTVSAPSHASVPAADTRLSQGFSSTGKPTPSSITINSKYGEAGSPLASPTVKSPPPATVPVAAASVPSKVTSPTSSSAMSPPPPHKSEGSSDSKPRSQSISSHFTSTSGGNNDAPDKSSDAERKKFDGSLSASDRGDKSSISQAASVAGSRLSQSHKELTEAKLNVSETKSNTDFRSETKFNTDFRSEAKFNNDFRSNNDFKSESKSNTDFRTESKSNTDSKPETKSNNDFRSLMSQFQDPALANRRKSGTTEILPLKSSDSSSTAKEDVKTRREARSKTLPAAASEQSTPKVQRSSSHHARASKNQPEHSSKDKNADFTSLESAPLTSSLSTSNQYENVMLESFDFPVTLSEKLPFSVVVQKKDDSHEVSPDSEAIKLSEISSSKSEMTTLESKSSLPSSGHLEKKRGSIETVSYKNKEMPEQTFKKPDISDVRRRNVEISSASKRGSIDVSSTKRDSVEIEISQLTSVRASRNLFDSGSKVNIQKDSTQPATPSNSSVADRTKLYSASTSSTRSVLNTGQSHTSSAASTNESTKSVTTSGSITHSRGGSVKSTFHSRGGSIKGPTGSSQPNDPLPTVTETTPAPKQHESSGSSTAPPSSQPASALHASTHVTAPPNSSLASQTPTLVTPLSFSIKPFSAYTPKHATNIIAPVARPASAFAQPTSKHTTTPSATSAVSTSTLAATSTIAASSSLAATPTLAATSTIAALSPLTSTPALAATSTLAATPTPAVAHSFDVKPASSPACGKGVSISNVKPTALVYPASNVSTPVSLASSVSSSSSPLSSSYSLTSHTTSTTTSSSKSSQSAQPISLRSHSSFTTPAALKPQITPSSSSSSLSQSTRPSSIMKSPSFKAAATTSTEKLPTADKKPAETKIPATSSSVPAWRTHLTTKEVKIEIIENTPSLQTLSSSSQSKSEMLRNTGDKVKMSATVKKTESLSGSGATVETEKTTRRTSKVLDMVKNFQNLQAPS